MAGLYCSQLRLHPSERHQDMLLIGASACRLSRAAVPRRQSIVVNSRPRVGGDKSILKEGPGGKQIDSDAVQNTAEEYLERIQACHTAWQVVLSCCFLLLSTT